MAEPVESLPLVGGDGRDFGRPPAEGVEGREFGVELAGFADTGGLGGGDAKDEAGVAGGESQVRRIRRRAAAACENDRERGDHRAPRPPTGSEDPPHDPLSRARHRGDQPRGSSLTGHSPPRHRVSTSDSTST